MSKQLHCKPGDLAIVVKADILGNVGQLVEILGFYEQGPPLIFSNQGQVWWVRTTNGLSTLQYSSHTVSIACLAVGPVPDNRLQRICSLTDWLDPHCEQEPSRYGRGDPMLEHLRCLGVPLTVDNYVEADFPDGVPYPLPGEYLGGLPQELLDLDPDGLAKYQ